MYCCIHTLLLGTCTRLRVIMASFVEFVPKFGCDLFQRISMASWGRLRLSMIVDPREKHEIIRYRSVMASTGPRGVFESRTVAPLEAIKPSLSSVLRRTSLRILENKRLFRRSAVSCAKSGSNVYLIPTYDTTCNRASSGASCGVSELNLCGCVKLWYTSG